MGTSDQEPRSDDQLELARAVELPPTEERAGFYLDMDELWAILHRLKGIENSVGLDWHDGHTTGRNIYKGDGPDDQIGSMDNRVLGAFVGHAPRDIQRLLPIAAWAKVDFDDAQRLDRMAREAHDELHKTQAALQDAQLKLANMVILFSKIIEQGSPLLDGAFGLCAYCKARTVDTSHKEDCLWLRARTLLNLPPEPTGTSVTPD